MDRRSLLRLGLAGLGGTTCVPGMIRGVGLALAQGGTDQSSEEHPWGNPVVDMHFHCRRTPEANLLHLDGAGVSMAALLTPASGQMAGGPPEPSDAPKALEIANQTIARYLGRFFLFTSTDDTKPDAADILRKTAAAGTRGFGELSAFNMAIDGPEMGRIYDLAAEMQVPVLMHFQDIPSPDGSHAFQTPRGFTRPQFYRLENALKMHSKTIFIGHGPSFWGNLGPEGASVNYPSGPVKPGGLTQKLLDKYPNLHGGLDAGSGINALHRDPEFSKGFLVKHQDKLMFGSDCGCTDGRGGGGRNGAPGRGGNNGDSPLLTLVKGKCLARVQLTQLKQLTSPDVFRKITWENGRKLARLDVAV
jgi:uncharacterized protein